MALEPFSHLLLRGFDARNTAAFEQRALAHLRQRHAPWCSGRDTAGLLRHVRAATAFGQRHGIHGQANLLRLLDIAMRPGFSPQPSGYALYRLTQPGYDETTRLLNYEAVLAAPQPPVLVSLDTPMAAVQWPQL